MKSANQEPGLVELGFPMPFEETLLRIQGAIQGMGLEIFALIDHAANAAPCSSQATSKVLLYGRPDGGRPEMPATPDETPNLLLRVLLREESASRTIVSFHPIAVTLAHGGAPAPVMCRLEPAQQLLVDLLG